MKVVEKHKLRPNGKLACLDCQITHTLGPKMEIKKEDLESFLKEQMELENIFACTILTKNGMTITKFSDDYYMETSPQAAQAVLSTIAAILKLL